MCLCCVRKRALATQDQHTTAAPVDSFANWRNTLRNDATSSMFDLSVHCDFPRIARSVTVGKELGSTRPDEPPPFDLTNTAANKLRRAMVFSKLSEILKLVGEGHLVDSAKEKWESIIPDDCYDMAPYVRQVLEQIGEGSKVAGVLKLMAQPTLFAPLGRIRYLVYSPLCPRWHDTPSWRISVTATEDGPVTVTHECTQRCDSAQVACQFSCHVTLILEPDTMALRDATIDVYNLAFDRRRWRVNSTEKKAAVIKLFQRHWPNIKITENGK
eukprot:TRINITY_DN85858_c0_g1_i1.p1 TRINITY_DN85858_c0_g1~~TRINITY_DN85858_c0_g1_i1.p1  ORF type:complete len:271 (+),score=5.41 TRINITY_DN85858_c0_g1_i1:24-836(+)